MPNELKEELLVSYTDGGARGNPGPAAIGVVFYKQDLEGNRTHLGKDISKFIGEQTNNYAEYNALITAMEHGRTMGFKSMACYLDSELVVKQVSGLYKVREETLKPLYNQVKKLSADFNLVTFNHVHREKNAEADKLVNLALDEHEKLSDS